ncbi:cytoplasmic protein [Roseibium sp. HPY-6]|uniref:cytoplasmic protein n=1 Tax=Roseibium sp. HPY-6 TaxID=3229852 RepID=UPI00338EFF67
MNTARFVRLILSALAICTFFTVPSGAEENRAYLSLSGKNRLPDCTANSVQKAVRKSVARAYADYYGGRKIVGIQEISELAFHVNGVSPLARRYCTGEASMSDGSQQHLHYLIEENAGFVGISWNVETCLSPLDKWRVYGSHCSTARPH